MPLVPQLKSIGIAAGLVVPLVYVKPFAKSLLPVKVTVPPVEASSSAGKLRLLAKLVSTLWLLVPVSRTRSDGAPLEAMLVVMPAPVEMRFPFTDRIV